MSRAKGANCLLPAEPAPRSAMPGSPSPIEHNTLHQSAVLVLAHDRLVGIFTERDLVRLTASQRSLHGVKVGEVMKTTGLQTLLLSDRHIVQFQTLELDLERLLAQTVMSSPLFCLQPKDSLWAVQQVMQTRNIRRVVITNDRGELEGILTQSNLLHSLDPLAMLSTLNSNLQSQLTRATELEQTNQQLQAEITSREQVEAELRRATQLLREQAIAKTAELALLTEALQVKVVEQDANDLASAFK